MVRLDQASLGFLLPSAATGAASAVSVTPDALDIPLNPKYSIRRDRAELVT